MKRIFCLVLSLIVLLSFAACNKLDPLPDDLGGLVGFSYNFGSFHQGYWEYRIYEDNGKFLLEAEGFNGVDLNAEGEIPEGALDDIALIIEERGIKSWNGFDKSDRSILDGYSFSLTAEYEDGSTLTASGYMKYPDRYEEAHDALAAYLETLANSIPD